MKEQTLVRTPDQLAVKEFFVEAVSEPPRPVLHERNADGTMTFWYRLVVER
jgi:hypothetical protein